MRIIVIIKLFDVFKARELNFLNGVISSAINFSLFKILEKDLSDGIIIGITRLASYSKPGYPYDNASFESWHGHLKRECVYQFKYKNFEEAYQSIFWYIEAFYNSKRIHQSLGYLTPNQFEKAIA